MSDIVIRVENVSKLYRLGEVGTGSLAHDVNRWWHKVRGKEDPYLKIGEVNDRTKSAKQTSADGGSQGTNGTTNHTNKHENLTTIERKGGRENEQPKVGPKGEEVGTTESNGSDGHNQAPGQVCGRLPQGSPVGETIDHREKDCRRQPEGCSEAKSTGNERVKCGTAGGNQRADSAEFLEGHSQAGLQMDSEKLASIRSANTSSASGANASSAEIGEICGKQSDVPDGAGLRPGEFFAVKDVSFELRRGELRTLGQSEKEVSKKCLGATKVPDSGRRRHQCLGLIGHNGALPALLALAG